MPKVRQDFAVRRIEKLDVAPPKHAKQLSQGNHVTHPTQKRRWIALLSLHIDCFISPYRVHDDGTKQPGRRRGGKPGVAISVPLHGCANAVTVTEINVVPHSDFIPVVKNRCTGKREKQTVQQFDPPAVIIHQRRKAAANAKIDAHPRVRAVSQVHVIALIAGDHLQSQLIMISQEQPPLACFGNTGSLRDDVGYGQAVFLAESHINARHERKMKGHVEFIAVAEIRTYIGWPLVRFRQEHPAGIVCINLLSEFSDDSVCFRKIFATGTLTLHQIGDRVYAQCINPYIEPVTHHLQNFFDHFWVVVVQIGLVRKEAMPIKLVRHGIPGPVGPLGVSKNDSCILVLLVSVAPHIKISLRRGGRLSRRLKPRMLIGGVIHHQFDHHLQITLVSRR